VPDEESGIDLMRRRIERASRRPPPAPRARGGAEGAATPMPAATAAAPAPADPAGGVGEGQEAPVTAAPAPRARRTPTPRAPARPRLGPDLPPVNLAIRVRKPLDDHLADLIHDLRRDGVRTSKVELIEMLLWEQTSEDAAAVRRRLGAFRAAAPRGAGAPIADPGR
jgi:hypothetical protein